MTSLMTSVKVHNDASLMSQRRLWLMTIGVDVAFADVIAMSDAVRWRQSNELAGRARIDTSSTSATWATGFG